MSRLLRRKAILMAAATYSTRILSASGYSCSLHAKHQQQLRRQSQCSNADPATDRIKQETLDWFERVVIGLNLCPFAEKPHRTNSLHTRILHGTDILNDILLESQSLVLETGKTTILICPDLYPDNFSRYLDAVEDAQDHLRAKNLDGLIQLATFHPHFQFQGSNEKDVENSTNKSPYPLLHILREEDVAKAVEHLEGDASRVWKRNVNLLRAMEQELEPSDLQAVLQGSIATPESVQALLKRFRRGETSS
jgi:hypothetical protein